MAGAMKKINELSEAVLKCEGLQVLLSDKIAAINKKLPKLQSKDDATERRLSALQAEVGTIKTEVKELTESLSSTDEILSELQDDVNELEELTPRVDSLLGLRGEVFGTVHRKLQILQEAITRLEKRDRILLGKIESIELSLEIFSFQNQLQDLRDNAERDRKLLDQVRSEQETFRDIKISILGTAGIIVCVWFGALFYLCVLIMSIY